MDSGTRTMPGVGWLAAVGLVLVGALMLAFVLGEPGVAEYELGTPEAAAQAYVQALLDGDGDAAREYVGSEDRYRCRGLISPLLGRDVSSAVFASVEIDEDRAVLRVRLSSEHYVPDPFGSDWDQESRLVLERRDGRWLVIDAEWPLDECIRR